MSPDQRLFVVVPCFRDTESFLLLRERISAIAEAELSHLSLRFIVIDDSAGADPAAVDLDRLDGIERLVPPFNVGHQRAIVFGLRELSPAIGDTEFVVTMDSDGEDRPEDLPALLAPLEEDRSHRLLSVARRTKRRESPGFKVSYRLFRNFFRVLTGEVVSTGNFAAMKGGLMKQIIGHPYFDIAYSATLIGLPLQRALVPCERGERYAGRSGMNASRLIAHGLGMLVPFTDRIAVRGFVAFSASATVSLIVLIGLIVFGLFTGAGVPDWLPFATGAILLVSLISLGFVTLLFATFSQTRALSFSEPRIMHPGRSTSRSAPTASEAGR
jgi:hypothetical protein